MYTIIGKNGKERNTTLKDAKKLGLVPSVTEIIKTKASGYQLEIYKQNQLIDAAWDLLNDELSCLHEGFATDSDPNLLTYCQFKRETLAKSVEHRDQAAAKGSIIHDELEARLKRETPHAEYDHICNPVEELLKKEFPDSEFIAEHSFHSDFGFGGKCDLHCPKTNIILDYKTKAKDTVQNLKMYDEHKMQLAAYGAGIFTDSTKLSGIPPECYILYISTETPGELKLCKTDGEDDFRKYWNMFLCLLEVWQLEKGVTL